MFSDFLDFWVFCTVYRLADPTVWGGGEFSASVLRVTICVATYWREEAENVCAIDLQQQDRKFAYNVRLRRVRETIVAVESNNSYSECVFVSLGI